MPSSAASVVYKRQSLGCLRVKFGSHATEPPRRGPGGPRAVRRALPKPRSARYTLRGRGWGRRGSGRALRARQSTGVCVENEARVRRRGYSRRSGPYVFRPIRSRFPEFLTRGVLSSQSDLTLREKRSRALFRGSAVVERSDCIRSFTEISVTERKRRSPLRETRKNAS